MFLLFRCFEHANSNTAINFRKKENFASAQFRFPKTGLGSRASKNSSKEEITTLAELV